MRSFVFADRAPMSFRSVMAGARTGDVVLYAGVPRSPPNERREKCVPTVATPASAAKQVDEGTCSGCFSLSAMLAMTPIAIACSDGAREASKSLDCVAVVVEAANGDEPNVLIYDSEDMLITLPLSRLLNRPACLRPLLTDRLNTERQSIVQRQAAHRMLKAAVDDICNDRLPKSVLADTMQSQTYLAAYLLWRAGVLAPSASEFRAYTMTPDDAEVMFGAEASILDVNVKQTYAYGNQIWLS